MHPEPLANGGRLLHAAPSVSGGANAPGCLHTLILLHVHQCLEEAVKCWRVICACGAEGLVLRQGSYTNMSAWVAEREEPETHLSTKFWAFERRAAALQYCAADIFSPSPLPTADMVFIASKVRFPLSSPFHLTHKSSCDPKSLQWLPQDSIIMLPALGSTDFWMTLSRFGFLCVKKGTPPSSLGTRAHVNQSLQWLFQLPKLSAYHHAKISLATTSGTHRRHGLWARQP
eukprot:1161638-Pelagomonas_calceolata.AAC.3